MSNNEEQSFIRWQEKRIEQLSFVNNLLIFLATGMLVFQVQLAVRGVSFTALDRWIIVPSTLLIYISLILGCYLAWNRLVSFRITAQVSRKRETEKEEAVKKLRAETKTLDKRTWCLLRAQIVSLVLGTLFLVIFAIIHFIE